MDMTSLIARSNSRLLSSAFGRVPTQAGTVRYGLEEQLRTQQYSVKSLIAPYPYPATREVYRSQLLPDLASVKHYDNYFAN